MVLLSYIPYVYICEEAHPVLQFSKTSGSKQNPECQTKLKCRVATSEYTYEGLLSLYTRLDKSYTIPPSVTFYSPYI